MTKEDFYKTLKDYSTDEDYTTKYLLIATLLQQSCDTLKYESDEFKSDAFEKLCIGIEILHELNKKYLVRRINNYE